MKHRGLRLAALPVFVFVLGCASKFTHERFSMIQPDVDDRVDVRETLGKPRFENGDQWVYEDADTHHAAIIHFSRDGRVNGKEWMDGQTGAWEGQNPDAAAVPAGDVRATKTKTRTIDRR